jgi:acetylornithine deacetylase/succinyl-diaminopimelate desuccinylase-like protein
MFRCVVLFAVACGACLAQVAREDLLREFVELLSIPNIASDKANIRRNAEAIQKMFGRRGVTTRLLEHPDAPPVVYGELAAPGAARTLVFYAHYDGQPVNAAEWRTGDPFKPVQVGDRLYGRSSSDDKAAIIAMAGALDKVGPAKLTSNIKFFFEGEEEAGSPHLAEILRRNAAALKADLWLICDGPVHQSGRNQVYFGARGVVGLEVTIYGAGRELHSGHYGGWAPNPALMLAHLLASMRDEDGRSKIAGLADDVTALTALERNAIAATPRVDGALKQELGLKRTENPGKRLEEIVNQPLLNIRGLRSADTGKGSRNVVPASATASVDIRLVKGLTPSQAVERVRQHIRKQGYFVVTTNEPDMATRLAHPKIALVSVKNGGYPAAKTAMELPLARAAVAAISKIRGPVVEAPTLGGSVPLYMLEQELNVSFVGVPIANYDNNQHAANENIRLQNLWDGIEVMAALMTMP